MSAARPERWEELACDAALVGLDEAERAELAALAVPDDDLLAIELAAGEIAAAALATVSDDASLPPMLGAAIVARLGPAPAGPPPARADGVARRAPKASPAWLPWALAAAAAILAVYGWTRPRPEATAPPAPSRDPEPVASIDAGRDTFAERAALLARPGAAELPWKATKDEAAKAASGEVVWHAELQRGFMRFRGLAPNDPTKAQYQLWIFDAERDDAYPVDGGVFDVGPGGEVVVPIEAKLKVGRAKLFAVTVEKPGGVVVSKRERIVLTAAPSG